MKKRQYNPTYESTTFLGTVVKSDKEGKHRIEIDHPLHYQHFVNHTCRLGDKVALTMTNRRPRRSLAQNRYMHLYFSLIAEGSGHTMMEVKNWAKGKHLCDGITELYGSKVRKVKETSKLNMSELCEFLNRIESDTGIPLPDPAPFNLPLTFDEYRKLKVLQKAEYRKYKFNIYDEEEKPKTKTKEKRSSRSPVRKVSRGGDKPAKKGRKKREDVL